MSDDLWKGPSRLVPFDETATEADLETIKEHFRSLIPRKERRANFALYCEGIVAAEEGSWVKANDRADAAEWLQAYRIMQSCPEDQKIEVAIWLGEMTERLKWRWALVHGVSASAEVLVRERVGPRMAFVNRNEGRNEKNAERRTKKAVRIAYARDLSEPFFQRNPGASKSQAAAWVFQNWNLQGEEKPEVNTIRLYL